MADWISVDEALPTLIDNCPTWQESALVLAYDGWSIRTAFMRRYSSDDPFLWYLPGRDGYNFHGVSHWMPLPLPPRSKRP